MAKFRIALMLLIVLQGSFLKADDVPGITETSYSGGTRNDRWYRTIKYRGEPKLAPRPNEQTLDSLIVEWDEPRLDTLGNVCRVSGRILSPASGGNTKRPVNWHQGVSIILATEPELFMDWSKGVSSLTSMKETDTLSSDGEFGVEIDLRDADRKWDLSIARSYQFGILLATHTTGGTNTQVKWASEDPVLKNSIQMLKIPKAAEISRELSLVNIASEWPNGANAIDLIRAVNALQQLGKEKALDTLESYTELRIASDKYWEGEILSWIVLLLFEPIELEERTPYWVVGIAEIGRQPDGTNPTWPLGPIALVDDVPFLVGYSAGSSGPGFHPMRPVWWAREKGVIRDKPLQPTTNPVVAGGKLLSGRRLIAAGKNRFDSPTNRVVRQVLGMVQSNFDEELDEDWDRNAYQNWEKFEAAFEKYPMTWDRKSQNFVTSKK